MGEDAKLSENDQKEEIKALIKLENNPERRALLLILDAINDNMIETVRASRSIAAQQEKLVTEFDAHVRNEAALQNQIKGGSKVAKVLVNSIRVLTLTACTIIYTDIRSIHAELAADKVEHQIFKDKLQVLERKVIK